MKFPRMENHFLSARASFQEARVVLLGCPFDGTASFRPGARFGPSAIRRASWGIETYSPYLDRDLEGIKIHDLGDLELPHGEKPLALRLIRRTVQKILGEKKIPVLLGGDHLITLPVMEAMVRTYPDLHLLHLDAHTDLRGAYLGEPLSHSTVMRRVSDLLRPGRLFQIGPRSGTKEEFELGRKRGSILPFHERSIRKLATNLRGKPVYVSLDLDVIDPSLLPGVGTPEPGGFLFESFLSLLKKLSTLQVVGFDIVELTPDYDPTQISSVTAAVILREMILTFVPPQG